MSDADLGHLEDLHIAVPAEKLIPTLDSSRAVQPMGSVGGDDLHIFLREETLREIVLYAKSDLGHELGGVLPGSFYQHRGRLWVEIDGYIRAEQYVNTSASFKFTHDTWSAITREKESRFADKPLVGWQHTHPGYGVFLSGMDLFIQNNFFNLPYQVALVVDPRADTLGFFQWKRGKVHPCGFFYVREKGGR